MNIDYDSLIKIRDKLKVQLQKERPALKTLCRVDTTGSFAEFAKISAGLRLDIALESLRTKRYCTCCRVNLAKSGVCPSCLQTEVGKQQAAATKFERMSSRWHSKSAEELERVMKQRRDTSKKRYGVSHPMKSRKVKERVKAGCIRNLGVENPSYSASVKRKRIQTSLRKHGVRNPMQDPSIFMRNRLSRFETKQITVLGKDLLVQGYEPQVLKQLEPSLKRVSTDTKKMPQIFYHDRNGKRHRYFPDAILQTSSGRNILLEVKSPYTLLYKDVVFKAKAAFDTCSEFANLEYWIAVFHPKNGIHWIGNMHELRSSLN